MQRNNENADRVALQIESAQRHLNRQLSSREEVLKKYHLTGNTRMIPATEGQIRKIKERFDTQRKKLEQKSELRTFQFEVCAGAILVQ